MTYSPEHSSLQIKLDDYKGLLKAAKKEKAEIAVQFKNLVEGSSEHSTLIAMMQSVSGKIKEIEQQLKATEKEILAETSHPVAKRLPPLLTIDPDKQWNDAFNIRELSLNELNAWYVFVASIPNSTAYHQKAWKDVIEASFSNPTRIWVAVDSDNKIIGGVPLTFFDSKLFGTFAVSIPYLNYGGVISLYMNIAQKLLEHLQQVCVQEKLSYIEVRTMQSQIADSASSKKASMILELPATSEELDKNLGSKIRAQYKKCEEHQPKIQFGKLELLNDFYKVFAQNMRDLGTPVYGKNWFANILKNSDIDATLAVVYVNNKPVSTGFLVGHNGMLEIPWASTIKEANSLNTNMWMYRKILDYAIHNRFAFFDFGRSTQDAGTYKFKKQWGSLPYLHYWYKIVPGKNEEAPELNPDNPKFALMIAVWKRIPVWLTKIIGPVIIRNIP